MGSSTRRIAAVLSLAGAIALAACELDRTDVSGVLDLEDRSVDPLAASAETPVVLVFVRADCPISNRYSPEIKRLAREFGERGVRFSLVYTDPRESPSDVRAHLDAYGYEIQALRDTEHALVGLTGARVTPQAAIFTSESLRYIGRIDDWYADFGVSRPKPTSRDLLRALNTVLAGGDPLPASAPAIGCYISGLDR